MFAQVIAPIIGALLISISLITLSANINPSLHLFMNEQLKQIQQNSSGKYLKNFSLYQIKIIFSIYFFICGFVLYFFQGIKRLIVLIPLTITSIYMLQLTIIYGSTLTNIPVYIFLLVSILIILFHDCTEFDELEMK